MEPPVEARDLLARLRLLALDVTAVVGQLALRSGGELVGSSSGRRVSVGRAAQVVGVSDATIRRACKGGSLQSEEVELTGGEIVLAIRRGDLAAWATRRAATRRRGAGRGSSR